MPDSYETEVRVIYADTDRMGVVYHGRYLEYFEIGRNEMLREIGFPYKYLETEGMYLPVIQAHLDYYRAAMYDDLLRILTTPSRFEGSRIRFRMSCDIYSSGGQLLASGHTVHIIANAQGRASKPPKHVFDPLVERLFG